ncbi:MAG: tRNA (adenosine(37)-N6)-threonylcarbamoyltransferase complex ATPase subunit type 1 TsaE [Clostridia bacterium]
MKQVSHSPTETQAIGQRLAAQLQAGDVLLLLGDMGAGKSELTRGIARGLGITGYVTSPTFTILQTHESGRLPLYHFDWYRLSSAEELYELSMDEYLYGSGVAVIEWPSRAQEAIPESHLQITLTPTDESTREIEYQSVGGFRKLTFD